MTHPLTTATFAGVTYGLLRHLPGLTERAEAARMQRSWVREWKREWCLSEHPPRPALWGVPHPGFRGTGARFEEILVVTDSAAPEESAVRARGVRGVPGVPGVRGVRSWTEER